MTDQSRLISIFRDTLAQSENNELLAAKTTAMVAGTVLCPENYAAGETRQKSGKPVIAVTADTSFSAARKEADGKHRVAVLNFASSTRPGGGVTRGSLAQEECLCRSSNLYAALKQPRLLEDYYIWNQIHTDKLATSAVIYSPGVTVFKSDDLFAEPQEPWFDVDVLSCAAPNLSDKLPPDEVSENELREIFEQRIRNILNVARAYDEDVLILGAFGCGAFHNPPELVSEAFRHLLVDEGYGRYFEKIVFAIKANDERNTNLRTFQRTFG